MGKSLYQGRPIQQQAICLTLIHTSHLRKDFVLEKDRDSLTSEEIKKRKKFEYLQMSKMELFKGGEHNDFVAIGY